LIKGLEEELSVVETTDSLFVNCAKSFGRTQFLYRAKILRRTRRNRQPPKIIYDASEEVSPGCRVRSVVPDRNTAIGIADRAHDKGAITNYQYRTILQALMEPID